MARGSIAGAEVRPAGGEARCSFDIVVDHRRALVRATLVGFFTPEAVERFSRAQQAAVASLGCAPHQHRLLVDGSRKEVHSQAVADAFSRMADTVPLRARRIAVVQTGTLHRLQLRRILGNGRYAMFDTIAAAERWIAEDEAAQTVA